MSNSHRTERIRKGEEQKDYGIRWLFVLISFFIKVPRASCQADGNREITEFPCEVDKE